MPRHGLGVTIQLSPEMVQQVRRQKLPPQNTLFDNAALVPLSSHTRRDNHDNDDNDDVEDAAPSSDITTQELVEEQDSIRQDPVSDDDENHTPTDWDELMALPPTAIVPEEHASDHEDNDDNDQSTDSDDLSMSPPPTLPVLIIDLEALCGVTPTTLEEHEELTDQVKTALNQDDERYFDERSKELLDHKMAIHGDSTAKT